MKNALVSILIPAYNAERWIRDTIGSALSQTYGNTEVIVVDDGSADDTYAAAFSTQEPRLKVIRQTNTGACGARNKALSLAQGDYIQWLDADDRLHPEKIERQMAAAREVDDLTLLTAAWGQFFYRPEQARFTPDPLWRDHTAADWLTTKLGGNVWMNPTVWLVSRPLTELAGPWDDRLTTSGDDDGEYICRTVSHSSGVRFVADAKCYYRIGTAGSLNWNMERSDQSLKSLVLSLKLSIQHLLSVEDSERTRKASIRYLNTFLPYFYAGDQALVGELEAMAEQLGGTLEPPSIGWKYAPFEALFGPRFAKNLMNNWRAAKLLARGRWDKLMLDLAH